MRDLQFHPSVKPWLTQAKSKDLQNYLFLREYLAALRNCVVESLEEYVPDPHDPGYGVLTLEPELLNQSYSIEIYLHHDASRITILEIVTEAT